MADRLIKSQIFKGMGVNIYQSENVTITNSIIHHSPSDGVRAVSTDGVRIENNTVFNNAWWSSGSDAGINVILPDDENFLKNEDIRIIVRNNTVYGNRNFIPFFNVNWEDPAFLEANRIVPSREGYGTRNSSYILTGHGIHFESNGTTSGIAEISHNRIFNNGVKGMDINSPINYVIHDNLIYDNIMTIMG